MRKLLSKVLGALPGGLRAHIPPGAAGYGRALRGGWYPNWSSRGANELDSVVEYRDLYTNLSYIRSAVNHIAEQSIQTGPIVTAEGPRGAELGRVFVDTFRPLATAPRETLVDWLADLVVYYLVDGELFLHRLPGDDLRFESLDPSYISARVEGDRITGWRMQAGRGGQWGWDDPNYLHIMDIRYPGQTRGVSLLRAAQLPAEELREANYALDAALQEYGLLRGYWVLSDDEMQELEKPLLGESEADKTAREARNEARLQAKINVPRGSSPAVHEGTRYEVVSRGGDAFVRIFPDYVRVKVGQIARAMGVPEYVVSGSVSETNYSALRISRAEAEYRYRATQRTLESVLRWVWGHYAVWQGMPGVGLVEVRWPPQPPLDLQKDVYALAAAVRDKILSRRTAVEILGRDWGTELMRMEEEQMEFAARGITVPAQPYPAAPEDQPGGAGGGM